MTKLAFKVHEKYTHGINTEFQELKEITDKHLLKTSQNKNAVYQLQVLTGIS